MSVIDQPDFSDEIDTDTVLVDNEEALDTSTEDTEEVVMAEETSTTEVPDVQEPNSGDTTDPVANLKAILDEAVEAADPYTGDVPLFNVDAIAKGLRAVKSAPARAGLIASWSAEIFPKRPEDAVRIGRVLAIVAAPPEPTRAPQVVPEYEKLAHTLAILAEAKVKLYAEFDLDTVEKAQEFLNDPGYKLPKEMEVRIGAVLREARKGRRGTGPKVDWADAIEEALAAADTTEMSLNEIKKWAIQNLGASEGGAIDRRFKGLLEADESTEGKDGQLYKAGIRARVTDEGTQVFYLAEA